MTSSTVSSELQIRLQLNWIDDAVVHHHKPECPVNNRIAEVKVTAEKQNVSVCTDDIF